MCLLLTITQLEKIRVGKAYDHLKAGPSQAIQESDLDDNAARPGGMQSEADMVGNAALVPPAEESSSDDDDSGADDGNIETEVIEE